MAFKTNDYQQITLSDSYINLSPRTRKIVEKSWAKDFADIVFPAKGSLRLTLPVWKSLFINISTIPTAFIQK